jgi:hypothetical protein
MNPIELKCQSERTIKVYYPDDENEIEIEIEDERVWLSIPQTKALIEILNSLVKEEIK